MLNRSSSDAAGFASHAQQMRAAHTEMYLRAAAAADHPPTACRTDSYPPAAAVNAPRPASHPRAVSPSEGAKPAHAAAAVAARRDAQAMYEAMAARGGPGGQALLQQLKAADTGERTTRHSRRIDRAFIDLYRAGA